MPKQRQKHLEELVHRFSTAKETGTFEDRVKLYEELYDPEKNTRAIIAEHARDVVFGNPADRENFPGAYEVAYKHLNDKVTEDTAKVEDIDLLAQMLEKYVDKVLEKAMGIKFEETILKLKGRGYTDKQLRLWKGQVVSPYILNEEGRPINPFDEYDIFIKETLAGKTKVEIANILRNIANQTVLGYSANKEGELTTGLFKHYEHAGDMTLHLETELAKKGWTPRDRNKYLVKELPARVREYAHLITANAEELKKAGYKNPHHPEEGQAQGQN